MYTFLIFRIFSPTPSKIVKRFKFHTTFYKPDKLVTAFVSKLLSLTKSCYLEIHWKQCFETAPSVVSMTLLFSITYFQKKNYVLFKSAMELAQGMESADRNVRELNIPARDLSSTTTPLLMQCYFMALCFVCNIDIHRPQYSYRFTRI